jgi:antitoxin ParD1/3/4
MNLSLTPELEQLINERLESGMYNSASEVIHEALRLLQERDELQRHRQEELRREIAVGLAEADQGALAPLDIEVVKAEGRRLVG